MNHTILFLKRSLLQFIIHEESQTYHPVTYIITFSIKSSLKGLINKSDGWGFVLIL